MRPRKLPTIIVVSLTLVFLALNHGYYVIAAGDGDLLWNSNADEAYLFFKVNLLGYRVTYLEYPLEAFGEYFGISRPPNDRHSSMVVWRITSTTLHKYTSDDISLDFFTPLGNRIYANRDGTLWKWSGDHFEVATADEQKQFDGTAHLSGLPTADPSGWATRRQLGSQGKQVKYDMSMGGKQISLLVSPGKGREVSVDLLRTEQLPQRLWNMRQTPQKISKTEYDQIFKRD